MTMTLRLWRRAAELGTLLFLTTTLLSGTASAGAVDRVRQDNVIRIAYRADASPFSYKNSNDEPAGFMLDLCQAVVRRLAQQLDLASLKISYVTVTAVDRFEAIQRTRPICSVSQPAARCRAASWWISLSRRLLTAPVS
jgi:ABC-type amino acid transport substrate-binding protein